MYVVLVQRSCSPKDICPLNLVYRDSQWCEILGQVEDCAKRCKQCSFLLRSERPNPSPLSKAHSAFSWACTWAICVRDSDVTVFCPREPQEGFARALYFKLTNRHLFLQSQSFSNAHEDIEWEWTSLAGLGEKIRNQYATILSLSHETWSPIAGAIAQVVTWRLRKDCWRNHLIVQQFPPW